MNLGSDRRDSATESLTRRRRSVDTPVERRSTGLRRPPVVGVVIVSIAYLYVFYNVTTVVGGTERLLTVVAATIVAAIVVGRLFAVRVGIVVAIGLLIAGLATYVLSVPPDQRALFTAESVLYDTLALLTGFSVLRLTEAQVWAVSIAPVPTFLTWYLTVRGRDVAAASAAGGALCFFVLTGDAGFATTALGVAGAAIAVALQTLAVPRGVESQWDTVVVVLAAALLLSATVSVVPGGQAQPLFERGGGSGADAEASIVESREELELVGAIELSPDVRFVVESDREAYWRTGSYDRYTGGGWVRTGETDAYDGPLAGPPGESTRITQTVTAERELSVLPTAWQPVELRGEIQQGALVTDRGGLQPGSTVAEGEQYTVVSEQPDAAAQTLRTAGTDYPAPIEATYLQLPETTPDRVGAFTDDLTADDETAYDAARTIETYLRTEKRYSLSVDRPDGDVADAFLFEMDAGYCTYYATTMVTMLRTQGIPARFVTGYTPGEQVEEDTWVVRGQNAHAWVEVYFPDHGWVAFEPTPRGAYDEARAERLDDARQQGDEQVDTDESEPVDPTATPTPEPEDEDEAENESDRDVRGDEDVDTDSDADPAATETESDRLDPTSIDRSTLENLGTDGREQLESAASAPTRTHRGVPMETYGLAGVAIAGVIGGAHRFGYTTRGYRTVWVRYQWRRRDPNADVARAFARLEAALAAEYRPRRRNETPRAYLRSIGCADERVHDVRAIYERATYGGDVDRADADAAIEAVDAIVRDSISVWSILRR
ncbi:MAG: transglutaminaseTgpA domain-containing protein [Halobacteriota archaeon]